MKKLTTTIAIALLGFTTVAATPLTEKKKDKSEKAKTEVNSKDFATSSYLVNVSSGLAFDKYGWFLFIKPICCQCPKGIYYCINWVSMSSMFYIEYGHKYIVH